MIQTTDKQSNASGSGNHGIRHSAFHRGNDAEKFEYAYKGIQRDVTNIIDRCAKNCDNCADDQCTNTQEEVLSIFADSKAKYNLTDREYLEAVLLAYDKLLGHPAQPITPVVEHGRLDPDASFSVNTEYIMAKSMEIYIERYGFPLLDPQILKGKETQGFDKILEIAINELGLTYREALSMCLNYIHALGDALTMLSNNADNNKGKKQ